MLLRDEAVPGAERLGVVGGVLIVFGHVAAHDRGGVASDVESGLEAVLQAHTGNRLGADAVPGAVLAFYEPTHLRDMILIGRTTALRTGDAAGQAVGGIGGGVHFFDTFAVTRLESVGSI